MKPGQDVQPLEQASDDALLRQAIGAARRDLPDAERMQRLSAAFSAKLADASGSAPPADGGATAAGGSSLAAKATGLLAIAVVGGGIAWLARTPEAKTPLPPPMVTASAIAAPAASVAPSDPIPTVSVEDLPELAPSAAAPRVVDAPGAPGESELELLRRAQSTLGSNPAGALALVAEHERKHPRSVYAQEREVLAIEALLRAGRSSEAVARADRFAAAYPKSGHNRRIDSLLGR